MELTNKQVVDVLMALKVINLEKSTFLDKTPLPLPDTLKWDKIEGMLLGLAIGDALGNTSESLTPEIRAKRYKFIRNYLPNPRVENQRLGLPSDDTQMAFWTIEQMLEDNGKFVPENLAEIFADRKAFHDGKTVREFREKYNDGIYWFLAGPQSAGNGAIMRIAPMILPYLKNPSNELWADIILSAIITHNDRASTGSCLALVYILWELLRIGESPSDNWFQEVFCIIIKKFEGNNTVYTPRDGSNSYAGTLWKYLKNMTFEEELSDIASGAYMLETMPAILYILTKYHDDFERAMLEAVNYTKDNDTIAAVVGAVLGALHGKQAIPKKWIKGLSGRLTDDGPDGEVFELIERAKDQWWN